jgi:hypothetical protein
VNSCVKFSHTHHALHAFIITSNPMHLTLTLFHVYSKYEEVNPCAMDDLTWLTNGDKRCFLYHQ